jgi:hypothetical protein
MRSGLVQARRYPHVGQYVRGILDAVRILAASLYVDAYTSAVLDAYLREKGDELRDLSPEFFFRTQAYLLRFGFVTYCTKLHLFVPSLPLGRKEAGEREKVFVAQLCQEHLISYADYKSGSNPAPPWEGQPSGFPSPLSRGT